MRRVTEKSYYSFYKEPVSIQKEVRMTTDSTDYIITNTDKAGEGFGDLFGALAPMFSRISDVAKSVSPLVKAAGQSGIAVKNIADAVKSVKDAKGINVSMDILKQMADANTAAATNPKDGSAKKIIPPVIDKFKAQMALGKGLKKF